MNHYFDSKFREEEICPKEVFEVFTRKARAVLRDKEKSPPHKHDFSYRRVDVEQLTECLEQAKTEVATGQVHSSILETQKLRVFSAVKANFDVEKKTFVDLLLKHIKCILIQEHKDYVDKHVLRSKHLLDQAGENEDIAKHRNELLAREERLEECMRLLCDVPFTAREPFLLPTMVSHDAEDASEAE